MHYHPSIPLLLLALAAPLQVHAATIYMQDFNAFANGTNQLGDGSIISESGDASVQNGALRLTLFGSSENVGTFRIPGLTGASVGWTAQFSVTISSEGLPADGFSFSWGAGIGLDSFPGGSESGWDSEVDHLNFSFDTYDNGDGDWGLAIGGADGTSLFDFTSVSGPLLGVEETANAQVSVAWDPVRGASLRTTGFNTNINVTDIPTHGFTAADSNVFAFSARNGGLTETLSIDNISIQSIPEPGAATLALIAIALAAARRRRSEI